MVTDTDAELEAYFPIAAVIQKKDYVIRACDGDTEYLYLAIRKKNGYTVAEVYPLKCKPMRRLFKSIELAVTAVREQVFEGFEFGEREYAVLCQNG